MKLTLITPSYNQAQYLSQTIGSVLASTRVPDEYFVIDGGSTDGSVEIIRQYEKQLTTWVSEKDNGQADAINKGIKMATGDVIGWLNSDDLILPRTFELVLAAFEQNPEAAIVFGDALSIDQDGETINIQRFAPYQLPDLMQFKIICQPTVFFRKSALDKAGLMDTNYHFLLDHHLWLRIAQHGKMIYLPQTLAAARYHSLAKNIAQSAKFGKEAMRIVAWMQTDKSLSTLFEQRHKGILGGAYALDGYYQLEAKNFAAGLRAYSKAIISQPSVLPKELKHIVYGILGVVGLDQLKTWYKQQRKRKYEQNKIN